MKKLLFLLLLPFTILATPPAITFHVQANRIEAHINEQIAGALDFYVMSENPRKIYIQRFYVFPEFRNQKIGTALMQEALRIFENDHTGEISLMASPFGDGPRLNLIALMNFYRKHGFEEVQNRNLNNEIVTCANMSKKTIYYQEI